MRQQYVTSAPVVKRFIDTYVRFVLTEKNASVLGYEGMKVPTGGSRETFWGSQIWSRSKKGTPIPEISSDFASLRSNNSFKANFHL